MEDLQVQAYLQRTLWSFSEKVHRRSNREDDEHCHKGETLPENVLPPGNKKYKRNPLSSAKLVER